MFHFGSPVVHAAMRLVQSLRTNERTNERIVLASARE